MLQSGGQDGKWPISGPKGYITPAVWWVPDASEERSISEVPNMWP